MKFALLVFVVFVAGMALISYELSCEAMTELTLTVEESYGLGSLMNSSAVGKLLLSADFLFGVFDFDTLLELGLEVDLDFEWFLLLGGLEWLLTLELYLAYSEGYFYAMSYCMI